MSERLLKGIAALASAFALAGCGENEPEAETAPAPGGGEELVLVVSGEAPPYSYIDDDGSIVGLEVDIAKAAAAALGRTLVTRKLEFEDLLPALRDGLADMAASGLTITEGRRKTVDFTDSYATEGGAFLYRTGEPMPTMIRAEQLRMGTVDSMTLDFYLTRHGIDAIRYRSCAAAIQDVLDGKIDALFYDSCSLKADAEKFGGRLSVSKLETREPYGIAVRKGCPELMAALNAAIAERVSK